jgi:Na+-translocating ferredoxin:NAD+ oxidoreductase RnfD subunit
MSEVVATMSPMPNNSYKSLKSINKFFKTPKGLLVIALAVLMPIAGAHSGFAVVAPGVAAAAIAAMLVDAPILRYRDKAWSFPSGALLTGLLVAMVLSPFGSWKVAAATAAIGVVSKYVARGRSANVFNPAALALVVSYFAFDTGQSWWGALPELPILAIAALFVTGVFITDRVNKMPAVLAFLGVHFLLFTVTAFVGDPAKVAELYREPDLHAALFFAFFMVTDPPTSPPKARDQIVFGVITAVVSYLVFELVGAVYFLLAGLLVANVWEAWRRHRVRALRTAQ